MTALTRVARTTLAATFALFILAAPTFAGGDNFFGVWAVTDTDGNAFEIALDKSGTASAQHAKHPMKGTWKANGDEAVITWDTGWTTKISKDGDGYKKSAYGKGVSLDGDPTNTSAAVKAK